MSACTPDRLPPPRCPRAGREVSNRSCSAAKFKTPKGARAGPHPSAPSVPRPHSAHYGSADVTGKLKVATPFACAACAACPSSRIPPPRAHAPRAPPTARPPRMRAARRGTPAQWRGGRVRACAERRGPDARGSPAPTPSRSHGRAPPRAAAARREHLEPREPLQRLVRRRPQPAGPPRGAARRGCAPRYVPGGGTGMGMGTDRGGRAGCGAAPAPA